ncbi:hypothetical protein [Pseudothioclava arenosa]|uniref:Uncharacterized protein n=1 Tax=Pseudothioclava arenosa TaxID=1795308 RepID=A0A2A4CRF7_9RHOB|nr:hypothetical protein [Pseudothioclava arenosa]PCD77057.1 hypothetical protein CLN94_04575 [Pseudothioclava arenosa]
MRKSLSLAAVLGLVALPALAQPMTTAPEIRPILEATQSSWVALREYEGQDLLYFTHLLAWRCGLSEIRYGLNDAPPETVFAMEPCHLDTAQPNAITGADIYLIESLGSVQSVSVEIIYDDGAVARMDYVRKAILMP